jgi:hypothetical protein
METCHSDGRNVTALAKGEPYHRCQGRVIDGGYVAGEWIECPEAATLGCEECRGFYCAEHAAEPA